MTEKEVGEQKIATTSCDRDRLAQLCRRVEESGVAARLVKHLGSALVKQTLVVEMRARPYPKIPGLTIMLVGE